jgi:alkylhydroperoxidase family enzyme
MLDPCPAAAQSFRTAAAASAAAFASTWRSNASQPIRHKNVARPVSTRLAAGNIGAATRIQDGARGVTDEVWDTATSHLDEKQLSAPILNIAVANFFNRNNRTIRAPAGKSW